MNKTLSELINISSKVGKDASLVQGSSGNTSVKADDGKSMYIKATATTIKGISAKEGWRKVDVESVCQILDDKAIKALPLDQRTAQVAGRLLCACSDKLKTSEGPSIEAHLHAMLDKYVVHIHPTAVSAYLNAKNGQAKLERLFKDQKLPAMFVGYATPGYDLAVKAVRALKQYVAQNGKKPAIVFLEKHGLVVSAKTASGVLRITRMVVKACDESLKHPKPRKLKAVAVEDIEAAKLAIRKAYFDTTGRYVSVKHSYNELIAGFMAQRDAAKMLTATALGPDEYVQSNGSAIYINNVKADRIAVKISKRIEKAGKAPLALLVQGLGLFTIGKESISQIVKDAVESSIVIRANAAKMGGIKALSASQCKAIDICESSLEDSAGCGCNGDLAGRAAIVTGAGSGLGRAIAVGLAKAGANVAIADIDVDAAQESCDIIEAMCPAVETIAVKCNVTSQQSVDEGFAMLKETFGGLDIVVNAAGLAPAAPLVELDLGRWQAALQVNLTGYFLMAQAAARLMIAQDIGGSIINISSKSGLDASKNNSPYNATKAGEIHMARGWAMELGPNNIRVNCVCPGNVFEGSKIWNPAYIRQCAKKYGIKPEEVIPFYTSKTALNREIKGQDIADSVVFLCSDSARRITGQTIVTDAGQVFVR